MSIRTLSTANTESALFVLRREQVDPVLVARFTVDGEPMSKARARVVNGHAFTPERTRVAEAGVRAAFLAAERTATPAPLHSDTKYGVVALFFHQTRQRRDVDNMLKLILDALNGLAWLDDTQVVEVSARKSLVPKGHARTEVAVYEVGVTDPNLGQCSVCGKPLMSYDSSTRRTCSRECATVAVIAAREERQTRECRRCAAHCGPVASWGSCHLCTNGNVTLGHAYPSGQPLPIVDFAAWFRGQTRKAERVGVYLKSGHLYVRDGKGSASNLTAALAHYGPPETLVDRWALQLRVAQP